MTIYRPLEAKAGILIPLALVVVWLAGCETMDAPSWDNPLDPKGENYVMQLPILAPPVPNANRDVTITVFSVDPYASLMLIERKNSTNGSFVQVGSCPASQQVYVDHVPASEGATIWYRVRLEGPGGSLSPYSVQAYVLMQ
jgi:hypothetical protein